MAAKIIGLSELWDEITDYVGDLMDYAYIYFHCLTAAQYYKMVSE